VYEFKLPDLGEGIHEGEIVKWHVAVGETIEEDAPLVDVETDKAAVTIPSPKGGRVVALHGAEGDTIRVGQVIAVIAEAGEPAATEDAAVESAAAAVVAEPATPVEEAPQAGGAGPATAPPRAPGRPVPAAPATRRLARELGVDINQVPATGPGGRVTPEDVRAYLEAQRATAAGPAPLPEAPTPRERLAEAEFAAHAASAIPFLDLKPLPDFSKQGPVEVVPLRSIRRKVAHKMVTSMVLVPHVAHMDEADVTELEEFRRTIRERGQGAGEAKLTLLPFVIRAVAAGLKAAPAFNASLDPFREEIIYKKYYNIGVAADTGRGLVVPVIKDADRLSIVQLAAALEDLATRAREGKLTVAELTGGTFTITNIGALGGTSMIPAINYPEAAILGMGRVQEKPVVRNGEIVIRKMLPLTLAFDHRIADGADAARFVSTLVARLSSPNVLLLET